MKSLSKLPIEKDYILHGSITTTVLRLAGPAIASQILMTILNIVDRLWIGKLGAEAMAALGSCMFIIWIIYSLTSVLQVGTVALVARFVGMRDLKMATHTAQQATTFGVLAAAIISIIGTFILPFLFDLMKLHPAVKLVAWEYMRVFLASSILVFLLPILDGILRGSGDTKTPMKIMMLIAGLNIILDPLFIFGWGIFPAMGVMGAALATVIAQLIGVIIFFWLITSEHLRFNVPFEKTITYNFRTLRRIVKIGIPPSISGLIFLTAYFFITNIINQLDNTNALAALTIGITIESLSYLIGVGFAASASTVVGQNLGANQPDRAEKGVWRAVQLVAIPTGLTTLLFFIFPQHISMLFVDDPHVVELAGRYIFISAISQLFMGIGIVADGAFAGAGDTLPPMIISGSCAFSRIPLIYLFTLGLGFGTDSVWVVISATASLRGILSVVWFWRGKWKEKEITQ